MTLPQGHVLELGFMKGPVNNDVMSIRSFPNPTIPGRDSRRHLPVFSAHSYASNSLFLNQREKKKGLNERLPYIGREGQPWPRGY